MFKVKLVAWFLFVPTFPRTNNKKGGAPKNEEVGGGGGDEKHFFLLGLAFSSLLENRKKTVSVSFKCLHILNSFEEVKLFH